MSGETTEASHPAAGRQLLMVTEHHVPQCVLSNAASKMRFEQEDMTVPAHIECCRPKVSFTLRVHSRRPSNDNTVIVVEVCELRSEAPDVLVVCVCTGMTRHATPSAVGRSDYPTTRLVESFTGDGCRGTYRVVWTRQMTVRVEVYAAKKPAPLGPHTLGKDLDAARREGVLSDVVIKVDGEDMPAHRAVLAARSPVFLTMLQSGFMEDLEGVVRVSDVSASLFGKFLAYLYRGELEREQDWQGCEVDLMELADRYMVDSLKTECERRLMQVGMTGVVALLQTVSQRPCISSSVRSRVVEVAIANWTEVSVTHEWAEFEERNPILADFIRGGHQARRRSLAL